MMSGHNSLLLRIARCGQINQALSSDSHPCHRIVHAQSQYDFQLPEPWRGDIVKASLLFVSSNPGWGPDDVCPTRAKTNTDIVNFYNKGFPLDIFPRNTTKSGGKTVRPIAFWAAVQRRAAELYGRGIVPGVDFALTEVVHCKSRSELGVSEAVEKCFTSYFSDIATLSPASVVVILGNIAAKALNLQNRCFPLITQWYGKCRMLLWLPHPNARRKRTFAHCYSGDDIAAARKMLLES